jgi:tetratricopeptide (TPR) repeat protein
MKFYNKKIYIILLFLFILFSKGQVFAKDKEFKYTKESIANYFSGIVLAKQDLNEEAFGYLKQVQSLKNNHPQFNIEFIRTLVLLDKFEKAFNYSESIWKESEFIFEADLILGLEYFKKKNYLKAEKHFERINKPQYNYFFNDFIGNSLIAWSKAEQGDKEKSLEYFRKIPKRFLNIVAVQDIFYQCYFDKKDTKESFNKLIKNEDYNFSRYNFFLTNYLLHNNNIPEAKKVIKNSRKTHSANLLLKQTENFLLNKKSHKVKNFFDCHKTEDVLAEFFYIIANLYSSEGDFQLSNFYLKISLFLNGNFLTNKTLLAENFYYQNKNKLSKTIYKSLKSIGPVYSWHSSRNIARILIDEKGKKFAIQNLKKSFKLIKNPDYEHYYDLAGFLKDNKNYKEAIKNYSISLSYLKKTHPLFPKILDKRGTSYERAGEWDKAEEDLKESLKLLPDQPHVLNYLAYSWVDKGINLDEGLEMLKKANKLMGNDAYIIDSIGWTYYVKKNYTEADIFLQKAVELMPDDPTVNDHYADNLWMLNKNIQARYFWNYILNLSSAKEDLKEDIKKKLIFGIDKKSQL